MHALQYRQFVQARSLKQGHSAGNQCCSTLVGAICDTTLPEKPTDALVLHSFTLHETMLLLLDF